MNTQLTYEDILKFAVDHKTSETAADLFLKFITENQDASKIFVKVTGDNFDCSISGDFAKGIANIQDNFYRFCALALYGSDKINILKRDEKEAFLLHFRIQSGCTEAISSYLGPLEKLVRKCINKMTPNQITILLCSAVIGFGTYLGGSLWLSHEEKQADKENVSKALEALADSNKALIEKAFAIREDNIEEIAKNTTGAKTIQVGAVTLSETDISAIKQRASREKAIVNTYTKDYRIYQVNTKDPNVLKLVVGEIANDNEFTVSVGDDLFQDPEAKDLLWEYAKQRLVVTMQITESRKKSGATYRLESFELKE